MSNRKTIDLGKLGAAMAKPRTPRPVPGRRMRACCKSSQGFPHLSDCTRGKGPVQLHELTPGEDADRANQAWLDPDTVHSRIDALPDGEMTITVRVPG